VLVSNHKNYTKGSGMDRVKILLGHGIMTSEGDLWKRQRYMMQPAFHRRVITEFSKLIDACNERFIAKWEAQAARGELVNVTDDMSELTLEIVLLSIFGTDLERLEKDFGSNPFDIVTKETARDLKFAYKFRQLAKLVGRPRQAPAAREKRTLRFPADAHGCARQGNRRAHVRTRARRRSHDAHRRRPRNHRERPQLELVPAVAEPGAESLLHAEIDALREARPTLSDMETLRTRRTWSTRRCGCIRRAGCCRAAPSTRRAVGLRLPAGTDVLLQPYLLHRHPRYWKEPDASVPSVRRGARKRTSAIRLHAVRRGPAPLHR
jgi:cytochrome P450